MSKLVGNSLPDDLLRRLSGADLEAQAAKALLIVTIDASGWPHPAMLSYFEIVARDTRTLRLATYSNSTTSRNMRQNGRLTVVLVDQRAAYYVKGRVEEVASQMRTMSYNAKFSCCVEQVLADEANEELEPGAYVASGITYVNPNRPAELERARPLQAELLE